MLCLSPILTKYGLVPCGKCMACLVKKQRDWTFRIEQEVKYSPSAWFITLTYDEEHVPVDEELMVPVVSKRDIQLFMKRFRKEISILGYSCRYFICAEYGPKTLRPHYHGILFDLPLTFTKKFLSDLLVRTWQQGFITLAPVTPGRCRYVAKYCSSFMFLPKYLQSERRKPFLLVSRKVGIGKTFVDRDPRIEDLRRTPKSAIRGENGNMQTIPRYIRQKIYDSDMSLQLAVDNFSSQVERLKEGFSTDILDYEKYGLSFLLRRDLERKEQYVNIKKKRILNRGKL